MHTKTYRIQNWAQYNRALIQRGSLTVWIDEQGVKKWRASARKSHPGRPQVYSDDSILMMLILREVFHLPLRALQGFVISVFQFMRLSLPVPSYPQISRRAQGLHRKFGRLNHRRPSDIVFDSTGLKVYGEGEWKVRVHGKGKRRTWRKLHLALDPESHDIILCEMTGCGAADSQVGQRMMDRLPRGFKTIYGDGAYDGAGFRRKTYERSARCLVPPPKNASYKGSRDGWQGERDADLATIEGLGGGEQGRRLWKQLSGYHRRSLGETGFYRMKTMLGANLKARSWGCQHSEVICKCLIINRMNKLGMPKGRWLEADA